MAEIPEFSKRFVRMTARERRGREDEQRGRIDPFLLWKKVEGPEPAAYRLTVYPGSSVRVSSPTAGEMILAADELLANQQVVLQQ